MNFLMLLTDESVLASFLGARSVSVLLLIIAVSLALLSKGADYMIDGVVRLAHRTGLPRIVISATIVSLGTTAPEAFVSVVAAWTGNAGLALGNGVGSIIADTGLIFGLTCLLTRVPLNRYILNRTGWVQVGSATLLVVIALIARFMAVGEPMLGRGIGVLFLVLLCAYLYMTYHWARQSPVSSSEIDDDEEAQTTSCTTCLLLIFVGLVLVIGAARFLVPSAAEIAERIGVPPDVIAATMVALGTSLPELITAINAVRKGHPEIMVGNVVGADVLNCLFVIGAAAVSRPIAIPPNFYVFHFPTMLLILFSFRFFIFRNAKKGSFGKRQGAWLLAIYLIYVISQYSI